MRLTSSVLLLIEAAFCMVVMEKVTYSTPNDKYMKHKLRGLILYFVTYAYKTVVATHFKLIVILKDLTLSMYVCNIEYQGILIAQIIKGSKSNHVQQVSAWNMRSYSKSKLF